MLKKLFSAKNIFGYSAMSLYLINFIFHVLVWKTPLWELLTQLVWPAALVASMRYLGWELKVCFTKTVRWPVVWNSLVVLLTASLMLVFIFSTGEYINVVCSVLPVLALCCVPYFYGHNAAHAMAAIVVTGLLFIVGSSLLPFDTGAIVIIGITTLCLLWAFSSQSWWYYTNEACRENSENSLKRKSLIASLAFLTVLFVLSSTPLLKDAFELSAMGRPSLENSSYLNEQCRQVFSNANWFKAADMELGQYSFYDRVYAAVLAHAGWVGFGFVVFLTFLMLFSGGYLVFESFHIQKNYIVGAYCLIAFQTVGSIVTCFGWDDLLFAEITPLMSDDFLTNALYLLMCAIILPPRPVSPEEDEDYD